MPIILQTLYQYGDEDILLKVSLQDCERPLPFPTLHGLK